MVNVGSITPRWQYALLIALVVMNVICWNFVVFWRHEAHELRARVIVMQHELDTLIEASQQPPMRQQPIPTCEQHHIQHTQPQPKQHQQQQQQQQQQHQQPSLSGLIDELTEGGLCPRNISDIAVWRKAISTLDFLPRGGNVRGELFPNGSYAHFDTASGPYGPQWYCDKMFTNLDPWIEPSGALDVRDVVVGVYSGEMLFYSRASATSATWRTQFPNTYIYAAHSEPTVPVVGLGNRYGLRPDFETFSDVQPMQIVAVRDMYLRHPTAKWFYIIGDDVYIVANALVRMLEGYDASQELWLVQYPGEYKVPDGFDISTWPDRRPIIEERGLFLWQAGGSGWFVSNPVARKWAEHAERFARARGLDQHCNCPDVYSGLLLTLLGIVPTNLPQPWNAAMSGSSEQDEHSPMYHNKDPVMWHYQHPRRILGAHQWQEHRKLDRMVNLVAHGAKTNNLAEARLGIQVIVKSYRNFINVQMDVLRRWQGTIARLAQRAGVPFRAYDIPMDDRVLLDRDKDWLPAPEPDATEHSQARTRSTAAAAVVTTVAKATSESEPLTPMCPTRDNAPLRIQVHPRVPGEMELSFQSRSALASLLTATPINSFHCACADGDTTGGQQYGFCERRPRFVELAELAAPGYAGFGHESTRLNPMHVGHNYDEFLPSLLERFRRFPVRFVQIGARLGFEISFWRAYLGQEAQIVVVDEKHPLDFNADDASNEKGDEVDRYDRDGARTAYERAVGFRFAGSAQMGAFRTARTMLGGSFDIVFDDGSHEAYDQRYAFESLFPRVKRGGVYIVAALNAGYAVENSDSWMNTTKAMLDTLNRRVHEPQFSVLNSTVDQMVQSVHCGEEICAYIRS